MTAAVALGLQGCSDWDDRYDANGNNILGSDATLWEQINSRQELSNFATLLKKGNPLFIRAWYFLYAIPLSAFLGYSAQNASKSSG